MKLRNRKTGEVVVEINKIGLVWNKYGMPAEIGQYDSIAELCEEWEDYVPKEPLIKDEKIRKAVRAWAGVNTLSELQYDKGKDCLYSPYGSDRTDTSVCISFDKISLLENLEHRQLYTVAELCGEEEE